MNNLMIYILKWLGYYLIFPGMLFSATLGMIISWIDRKLTARIQWRKGPPWWQNFADLGKLLGKEIIIPSTAEKTLFIITPVISFCTISLAATILWLNIINPKFSFVGDIIVEIYLLMIPSIMLMLGSSASGNVIASLGVSREIKLLVSYELPLITAILVPIIKTSSIKLGDIIYSSSQPVILSVSGLVAFVVVIVCSQAKLGLVPFDISEAETEIASGVLIEYSGPLLAFWKITKQIMFCILPLFIIALFFPQGSLIGIVIKYLLLIVIFTLIRNINPRLRIDQSIRFFWFRMFPLSLISVILAILGK